MKLNINSVWHSRKTLGLEEGKWRIISLFSMSQNLALFYLDDEDRVINRPKIIAIDDFLTACERGEISETKFPVPMWMAVNEQDIPSEYKEIRDNRYNAIKLAINDHDFIMNYGHLKRYKGTIEYAHNANVTSQAFKRWLKLYWKYGLQKNALMPKYLYCGGKGKDRQPNPNNNGRFNSGGIIEVVPENRTVC